MYQQIAFCHILTHLHAKRKKTDERKVGDRIHSRQNCNDDDNGDVDVFSRSKPKSAAQRKRINVCKPMAHTYHINIHK